MKRFTLLAVLFLVSVTSSIIRAQSASVESDSELSIRGTDSDDDILVAYNASRTRIVATIRRRSSGALLLSRSYRLNDVEFIHVQAYAGNDLIRNATDIPSRLSGHAHRDTIYGGSAQDEIDGGTGNDVIYGGPGNDVLSGGDGADRLFGEDGDDLLVGGRGYVDNDWYYSFSELKNVCDVHSDAYADELDGGAGYDYFAFEPNDIRVGVHGTTRSNGEMTVAEKHGSIWWNGHAWPRNGGWFNPVRIWQARG